MRRKDATVIRKLEFIIRAIFPRHVTRDENTREIDEITNSRERSGISREKLRLREFVRDDEADFPGGK